MTNEVNIFISYTHQDEEYCRKLLNHLSALKRQGIIKTWYDREILSGEKWDEKIKKKLINSDIILLLISAKFIGSDYCYKVEVELAMKLHRENKAIIIPIILKPCDWIDLPISNILSLPKDARAISLWENEDEAWLDVINGIKLNCKKVLKNTDTLNERHVPKVIQNDIEPPFISCLLPRGFVIITNLPDNASELVKTKIDYYNLNGTRLGQVFYHQGSLPYWQDEIGGYTKLRILRIPVGDWNIAYCIIDLVIDLSILENEKSVQEIIQLHENSHCIIKYEVEKDYFELKRIPEELKILNCSNLVRNVYVKLELYNTSLFTFDLEDRISFCENLRREITLIYFDKLGSNHAAYKFIESKSEEFSNNFNSSQLETWVYEFKNIIEQTGKYF